MSVPSNTFKTYEAVGIREDLSDVVTNISPIDNPFYRACSNSPEKPKHIKHEFLTDVLAAAGSNAQIEGDDRTASAVSAATRLYNIMQIQSKTFRLSDTTEKVVAAGKVTSLSYQSAKSSKELTKDIEYAFLRGVRADGSASVARQMRGALNWIITNLDKAADATLNAYGTVTGGTARAITKVILDGVLQNIFVSGGNPKIAYCGPFQKRQISALITSGNYRSIIEDKKLEAVVDVYEGDFSIIAFKSHRNMPTDVLVVLDMDYWKKATLRPSSRRPLAKTGDSEIYDITVEHTLEASAETASGRITNLTTS